MCERGHGWIVHDWAGGNRIRFVAEAHGVQGENVIGAICILSGVLQSGVWGYGICSFCK